MYDFAPEDSMKISLALLFITFAVHPAFSAKQYSYFRVGNANDITTSTTPGTVLMGGGTDVDAAFQWMCQRSGNGDFLVIRATGTERLQSLYPAALPRRKLGRDSYHPKPHCC
jgi:hypothetical protein